MAFPGVNTFILSHEAVIAAVQMHLNAHFVTDAAPRVVSVKCFSSESQRNRYSDNAEGGAFVVTTEPNTEAPS